MKLYHYTSFENAMRILVSEKVRFSSPAKFNDPFEFYFKGCESGKNKTLKDWLMEVCGVFCMSHSKDNILMLSHYSSKHSGWIIEFEFNKESLSKDGRIAFVDLMHKERGGVYGYAKSPPNIDSFLRKMQSNPGQVLSKKFKDELDRTIASIMGTKREMWEYEQECRLITSWPDKNKYESEIKNKFEDIDLKSCGLSITKIYSGCKVTDLDKRIIKKLIEPRTIMIDEAIKTW